MVLNTLDQPCLRFLTCSVMLRVSAGGHLSEAVLGEGNQLLVTRGTDVKADRKQAFERGHDQAGLHGVAIPLPLHLLPLLV